MSHFDMYMLYVYIHIYTCIYTIDLRERSFVSAGRYTYMYSHKYMTQKCMSHFYMYML